MAIEVDSSRGTKTFIRIIFFLTLMLFILSLIFGFSMKIVVIVNLILLSLQVLMDYLEDYMDRKHNGRNWTVRTKEHELRAR